METQKCKSNESIPCQQSPHLFAICIFIAFPWLSKATDTTAMKRPGNTNKIRNLSLHLGDESRKKSIEMTIKPVELYNYQFYLTLKHVVIFFLMFKWVIELIMTVTKCCCTKNMFQCKLFWHNTTLIIINSWPFYCLHCTVLNACLLFWLKLCWIMKSVIPVDASLVSNYVT